jgi:hypothetical protein
MVSPPVSGKSVDISSMRLFFSLDRQYFPSDTFMAVAARQIGRFN